MLNIMSHCDLDFFHLTFESLWYILMYHLDVHH